MVGGAQTCSPSAQSKHMKNFTNLWNYIFVSFQQIILKLRRYLHVKRQKNWGRVYCKPLRSTIFYFKKWTNTYCSLIWSSAVNCCGRLLCSNHWRVKVSCWDKVEKKTITLTRHSLEVLIGRNEAPIKYIWHLSPGESCYIWKQEGWGYGLDPEELKGK